MTGEESRRGARAPGLREEGRTDASVEESRKDARGAGIEEMRGEPSAEVNLLAKKVVEAAVEVHRELGPGLLEAVYEEALCIELEERNIPFERQVSVPLRYKGRPVGTCRLDLLVGSALIIELKATDSVAAIHMAQTMSYLRATGLELALIINFNATLLLRGVHRMVLTKPR